MSDPEIPDEAEVERLCEVMHDAYEAAAVGAGWETQQASRKPWADVPEANKATMRVSVRAVIAAALPALRQQWTAEIRPLIENLTDVDPCERFDHHGFCQTHGWLATEPPCPHGRAQAWLGGHQ